MIVSTHDIHMRYESFEINHLKSFDTKQIGKGQNNEETICHCLSYPNQMIDRKRLWKNLKEARSALFRATFSAFLEKNYSFF